MLRGLPPPRIEFQQGKTTFGLVSSEVVLFILTEVEPRRGREILAHSFRDRSVRASERNAMTLWTRARAKLATRCSQL